MKRVRPRSLRRAELRAITRTRSRVKMITGVSPRRDHLDASHPAPFARGDAQARAIAKAGAYVDRRRGTENDERARR